MFDRFNVVISITLANKTYEESMSLADEVINGICMNCNPKFSPKVYFHPKTFESNIKVPDMDKALKEMVNRRKCIIITPKIDDYDVVINLLSAVKRWRENCDEKVFGKTIEITADDVEFLSPKDGAKASSDGESNEPVAPEEDTTVAEGDLPF